VLRMGPECLQGELDSPPSKERKLGSNPDPTVELTYRIERPVMSTQDHARLLNQLSRNQVQQILENYGYGVYDKELTEAVRQDLESGAGR
jgi:hypothetical protein